MTNDLFLIAHKVRGAPAFDVATQMECPHCGDDSTERTECVECDGLGFWWIIPTSGHRAYPYWDVRFDELNRIGLMDNFDEIVSKAMPTSLPDHYTTSSAPRVDLATALGLRQPAAPALPPLPRRL